MARAKAKAIVRAEKPTNATERQKALDLAMKRIEQDFGAGSIMRFSEKPALEVPVIPSGALSLDVALGVGGYPRGRVIEIYGPESSGKTTLALHAVAQAQAQGGVAAFIDAEHAMDPAYSKKLGVKIDELLISQPDSGEQALSIAELLINSNAVDIIVIDSVAALVPRAEIEGEMGDMQPGMQARLMSKAMRKLTASISRSNTTMIFINQVREKIGVVYGNPETTTGGRALKFYSTIRIEVRRIGAIKEGTTATGNRTRARVVKNKVAPPFRETEFDIMYGLGISTIGDMLDLAVEHDLIKKAGAWYSMDGERLGQGREATKRFLEEHPEITNPVDTRLRSILMGHGDPDNPETDGAEEE